MFVFDGKPRPQKVHAYYKRYGSGATLFDPSSNYESERAECVKLLQVLGIPFVQLAYGDAEAFCAELNSVGLVDGVISPDGDGMQNSSML